MECFTIIDLWGYYYQTKKSILGAKNCLDKFLNVEFYFFEDFACPSILILKFQNNFIHFLKHHFFQMWNIISNTQIQR